MRLSWFRVDPDSNVWRSNRREGFETWGRPCEDRSRYLSYAATSKAQYRIFLIVSSQEEPTLPTP